MRFIVIGCLGSMGRRRIRNLKALGITDIIGYDIVDYKKAKPDCWYTDMLDEIESFLENPTGECKKVDGIIVSVTPLKKMQYIELVNRYNVPCFCEADVKTYSGTYYSSASMRFYPAVQKIKEILDNETLGKIYTFTYHCGNNLYDWHRNADMKTYYAAKKESGGCLEIFPFELSWLSMLFGKPVEAKGFTDKKLCDKDISADDVFSTTVKFKEKPLKHMDGFYNCWWDNTVTGTILIDIISRPAIRELRIVGEKCNLLWDWNDDYIELEYPNGEISMIFYPKGKSVDGYNLNITEDMYIEEMRNFINAIQGKEPYYYPKEDEEACIKMLNMIGG
jgi:predicted dehydrogenase